MSTTPAIAGIIGRDYERSRLRKMFHSEEAEFAAILRCKMLAKCVFKKWEHCLMNLTIFFLLFSRIMKFTWNEHYWHEASQSSAWRAWSGYAFEALCFKHIPCIRAALNIPESAYAYTWRYFPKKHEENLWRGVQIDLVFDRNDGIVNICEMKYAQNLFKLDKEIIEELERKATLYQHVTQTTKQIFLSLITSHGIQASSYKNSLASTAILEDFF